MTCYSISVKYHRGPMKGRTTVIFEESLSHALQRTGGLPLGVSWYVDEINGVVSKTLDKGDTIKREEK